MIRIGSGQNQDYARDGERETARKQTQQETCAPREEGDQPGDEGEPPVRLITRFFTPGAKLRTNQCWTQSGTDWVILVTARAALTSRPAHTLSHINHRDPKVRVLLRPVDRPEPTKTGTLSRRHVRPAAAGHSRPTGIQMCVTSSPLLRCAPGGGEGWGVAPHL